MIQFEALSPTATALVSLKPTYRRSFLDRVTTTSLDVLRPIAFGFDRKLREQIAFPFFLESHITLASSEA